MSQDTKLQQAVLTELNWEPSVAAGHIGVTANAGVVTLSGHVASFPQRLAAEAAARRVRGVKAVVEEIEVRLPSDSKRGDDEIAAAAIERLAWDASIARDAIKVQVENGWITLTGEVEWNFQRDAAEQEVRLLRGVVGVFNHVTIKPTVNLCSVSDDVLHALHRSWFFDPQTISVSASGGKVRLSGTVRSPHERQIAAATAWAAPGVTNVENDLAVA